MVTSGGKWRYKAEVTSLSQPSSPVSSPGDLPHPLQPWPNLCSVALNVRMKTKQMQRAPCRKCKRHGAVDVLRHEPLCAKQRLKQRGRRMRTSRQGLPLNWLNIHFSHCVGVCRRREYVSFSPGYTYTHTHTQTPLVFGVAVWESASL